MYTLGTNGRSRACFRRMKAACDLVLGADQLGTDAHALVEQVIERDFIRDQADDALRRLDRGEHDLRVEHEQADQIGRGDE